MLSPRWQGASRSRPNEAVERSSKALRVSCAPLERSWALQRRASALPEGRFENTPGKKNPAKDKAESGVYISDSDLCPPRSLSDQRARNRQPSPPVAFPGPHLTGPLQQPHRVLRPPLPPRAFSGSVLRASGSAEWRGWRIRTARRAVRASSASRSRRAGSAPPTPPPTRPAHSAATRHLLTRPIPARSSTITTRHRNAPKPNRNRVTKPDNCEPGQRSCVTRLMPSNPSRNLSAQGIAK